MMINACHSMPAVIANKAAAYKGCCGKASYTIATLMEVVKCQFN